ncbi:1-phosphatidylinositol phosphodiesterase [Streptomyces sp. LamerLS-316]|uniref:phosphatidylinositol-specific phospholipase C n=1 Tax=unclassified Streptomyces TaxID=2593676 RepID=UPI000823F37F|nr:MULTISPECIES: phosphatidylinositol-specific phospholipase C [unclassified Streptomyces]MYQ43193.1 phosphatidylinositol-specific phospholipase C domain-containing protein [Streptomyces sp. SID4921]SCK35213.1 1-phosphatidylinositol phosphodiesterase [Streptomyces sp. LamerLS-316]
MSARLSTRRGFLTGALALSATAVVGAGPAVAAPAGVLGTQDWMGAVPDATPLRHLTIPGTHNSGARFGGPWTACQNTTIAEQLTSGIRFLDVRCRISGDAYAIHHGASYQNLNFDDVLGACRDFLAQRPSETVLMRVKQEYSEESDAAFRRIFDIYLDGKGWRSLLRLDPVLPDLGGARGKVVLLADNGGLPGVRYADPALFDIQDDYMAEPFAKYPKIEAQFRKAAQQPGKLFMNYVSTAALLPPRSNADRLNPQVHAFLDGSEASGWTGLGIVPLDYPATRSGLVESLIRHNPTG